MLREVQFLGNGLSLLGAGELVLQELLLQVEQLPGRELGSGLLLGGRVLGLHARICQGWKWPNTWKATTRTPSGICKEGGDGMKTKGDETAT